MSAPTMTGSVHIEPPITVIEPDGGWQPLRLSELWRYRELLYFLAWRDVKVRYKQTLLGAAWAVLQPLLMMIVFTLFFDRLAGQGAQQVPYPVLAFAGLLPWSFFSTALAAASQSVVGSERLITKVYFPRLAVPFAAVGAALVDLVIALPVLGGLLLWYGIVPGVELLFLPLAMAVATIAALGVGSLLAALNVAYRDFRYVVPFLVQLWMFATPPIYRELPGWNVAGSSETAVAGELTAWLLAVNPMAGVVGFFQASTLGQPLPWAALAGSLVMSALMFVAACFYFRRVERSFADVI